MSLFGSHRKTLTEQHVLLQELETLLGAVDVTGLDGWERTKRLHGGLAEAPPEGLVPSSGVALGASASPAVQQPLFDLPCFACGKSDAHTNAGALFCWEDHDLLSDEEKQAALERHLGKKAA